MKLSGRLRFGLTGCALVVHAVLGEEVCPWYTALSSPFRGDVCLASTSLAEQQDLTDLQCPSTLTTENNLEQVDEIDHVVSVPEPSAAVTKRPTTVALREGRSQAPGKYWVGSISVGTPPQEFTVVFDTGSPDLILPATCCRLNSCTRIRRYDPSLSTTSESTDFRFEVDYADARADGQRYTDVVRVGDFSATGQVLGAACEWQGNFGPDHFPAEGVLGMAFSAYSSMNDIDDVDYSGVVNTMIDQEQFGEQVFAFGMAPGEEGRGELTLGGVNKEMYRGEFTHVKITNEDEDWQVDLGGIAVNDKLLVGPSTSIIDTGTFFIIGDRTSVERIYAAIPSAHLLRESLAYWALPCKSNINVTLAFGGRAWRVPRAAFILPRDIIPEEGEASLGPDMCIGGIAHATGDRESHADRWVVGDVFLRGVYTMFDVGKRQVGFAALNQQY